MAELYKIKVLKMVLNEGMFDVYKQRHDDIWPELNQLLKQFGIIEYDVHFDPETNGLFSHLKHLETTDFEALAKHALMQKWWAYMADVMETHADNRPVEYKLMKAYSLQTP